MLKSRFCFQGSRSAARRGGVLLHGGGAGPDQPAADAVAPGHGAAAARGPRLPAAAGGLLPADAAGVGARTPVAAQAAQAVVAAAAQPQDAGVAASGPRREQEVPQGLRHGPPRALVHPVQVEEGVLQVRGLIHVTVTAEKNSDLVQGIHVVFLVVRLGSRV